MKVNVTHQVGQSDVFAKDLSQGVFFKNGLGYGQIDGFRIVGGVAVLLVGAEYDLFHIVNG